MSIANPFLKTSQEHIEKIKSALEKNGERAIINVREKLLFKIFDKKIKDLTSGLTQQAPASELETDLRLLKEAAETLAATFTHIPAAKQFSDALLIKIAAVADAVHTPSCQAPAKRRLFQLDDACLEPSFSPEAPKKTSILVPSSHPLQRLCDQDLTITDRDSLPFNSSAAKELGLCGIENKGGNDCFQNALMQALLTKKFKHNLIDKLPRSLRWHFDNLQNMDSQALRQAILQTTDFKAPPTSQADAHELFLALFGAKVTKLTPAPSFSKPLIKLSKDPRKLDKLLSFIEKRNLFFQLFLYALYIPIKLGCTILEKAGLLDREEPAEEWMVLDNVLDTPAQPTPVQPHPIALSELHFSFYRTRTWDVTGVPEAYKNDPNFGEDNNITTVSETADEDPSKRIYHNHLSIDLDPAKDTFNLQNQFNLAFTQESESTSAANALVKALMRERMQFESIPGGLALQIKRFETITEIDKEGNFVRDATGSLKFQSSKKHNPAEDFSSQLIIAPDLFIENIRPQEPVTMQLQSFIVHKGSTLKSGHYVAFRKVEGDWYYFNDSVCTKVTDEAAMRAAKHAYMYFFEREEG